MTTLGSPARKPNVLLISTDQQRGDCIGLDARGVRTPNIDRIGKQGVRFSKCITPHPMCQPARASILTGKLPYTHGVRDNGRNLDEKIGSLGLANVFAEAGYDTRFIGKAHFSSNETFAPTGSPECYHSTADFPADWGGPYFGFQQVDLMLRPHHHCGWQDPPFTLHYENFLDRDGAGRVRWQRAKDQLQPPSAHFQAWRSALEPMWHSSPWVGDRTRSMIEDKSDKPFFSWVSFPDPHPPFLVPRPWCDLYHPEDVDLPPHRDLDLDRRPWWHRAFLDSPVRRNTKRNHAQDGKNWGVVEPLSEQQLREITAIYYGMIAWIDHQIGRIFEALEQTGQLENTIVVFISDHGEWLGDHGLLLKGPMLYDGLLRVPCLMSGPSVPQGVTVDDPVSTVDLRQTLADLCGVAASPDNGRSLLALMTDAESREFALNEWEVDASRSGVDLDLRTVRSQRFRMSVDLITGAGELYDLLNDPHEMVNLHEDAGYSQVVREHLDMIRSRPDDMIPVAPRVGWH